MIKKFLSCLLAVILCLLPFCSYAQIWEGEGGQDIIEGLGLGGGSGSGGWSPEPLDPNATHYTITFKDNDDTTNLFSPIELNANTVVDLSVFVPTSRTGYTFGGWEDSNDNIITSVTMTSNITVTASWSINIWNLTLTDDSGTNVISKAYGASITETPTARAGYTAQWVPSLPATMPDNNLSATAEYIPEDPIDAVYTFYMGEDNASITYAAYATDKTPVHYDSDTNQIVDGDWGSLIDKIFTPVMLKSDGTVDYELSKTDYHYKADGVTPSDASNVNYNGNAMVRVKKFYVKVGYAGTNYSGYNASFSISLVKADNDFEALGFVDADGNEQDYAYMSMFEGYVDGNNKLRSIAGVVPTLGTTSNKHDYFVEKAKANGNGWNIESRAFKTALDYLHILLFKELRPVVVTGQGYRSTNGSVSLTTGQSFGKYNIPLETLPKVPNNGRSKTFWIENFLDGDFRWLNGFYFPSNGTYIYTKNHEPYTVNDLTTWTQWEGSYTSTTGKVKFVGAANSAKGYAPLFKDNTILFNAVSNVADSISYYKYLQYWCNTEQYISYTYRDNYGMSGQSDLFNYGTAENQYGVVTYYNSILTILCLGTSLGNGLWHNNCGGRLIYLPQPASLANAYSVQNLSIMSMPRNDLIQLEEEQIEPTISTETMEVNDR